MWTSRTLIQFMSCVAPGVQASWERSPQKRRRKFAAGHLQAIIGKETAYFVKEGDAVPAKELAYLNALPGSDSAAGWLPVPLMNPCELYPLVTKALKFQARFESLCALGSASTCLDRSLA